MGTGNEYEKGHIRTDRGLFLDKGNQVFNVCHPDFGVKGGGIIDDTKSIQAAIDTASPGDTIFFPNGTYKMGAVQIAKSLHIMGHARINLSGTAAGFELKDTPSFSNVSFRDLHIVGEGLDNAQAGIWHTTDTATNIDRVRITNLKVELCPQNIDISGLIDVVVTGCTIIGAVGTAAGRGYGIVSTRVNRARIIGNYFSDNGRHEFYSREGIDVVFQGNHVQKHASTSGGGLAAVNLIENQRVSITGNTFLNNDSRDISIDDDTLTADFAREYTIVGNVFSTASGDFGGISLGASVPASTTNVVHVLIEGNVFRASPARQNGIISIKSGQSLSVIGNKFLQFATSATPICVYLAGNVDADYDRIYIAHNTGQLDNAANDSHFVQLTTIITEGTTEVSIISNKVTVDSNAEFIKYDSTPTNPNIITDWDFEQAITLSSGSQTMNIAGWNYFKVTGNAGASTVTDFVNEYLGKTITLRFVDSNTTVNRNAAFLVGGSNFTSTADDILVLRAFVSSAWHELYRSVSS